MTHFLTIEDGKLFTYPEFGDERIEITSREQLAEVVNGNECACSSSIDFPLDATEVPTPETLALVSLLNRGGDL